MISCQAFRANLRTRTPEVLEHLRSCDACLDYAVTADPDNFFRAIGGEELVPPGGIDAFTADVMAQVRLRHAEGTIARRFLAAPRRLAAAAAIVVAVGAGVVTWQHHGGAGFGPAGRAVARPQIVQARPMTPATTKPVVETYQSQNATIVEMPSQGKNDANVVMIFDDSLPADL